MYTYTATSTKHQLRKVWRQSTNGPVQDETCEGFRFAKEFIYERHQIDNLMGFCDLLNRLSNVPNASLVLGQPLIERGGRTGLDFTDTATSLCVVDLDSLEYGGMAEEAVRFAFPFLRGRQFVYAYSPSSGFKAGHRLRVAFEVEPMDLTEQQIHAEHWNDDLSQRIGFNRRLIDYGIYKPGGFIFTARPELHGLDDPHPVRAFFVEGIAGPVDVPKLPDMIEVDMAPSVNLRQMPTLRWDASQRHNSVMHFMVAYRTAFPNSVFTECWAALSDEYERLSVRAADKHEFDERYIKMRFHGIRGSHRKRKAFPTIRQEVPLKQATQWLSDEVKTFVAANEPRVKVIEAEAGLGKTYWALHWLGVETRYAEHTNGIFFTDLYVPNHNLSAQIEADAKAQGMTAYTELGRGQEMNGRPVCTKHEAISKVQGVVKETRQAFCGNEMAQCTDRSGCFWWEQQDKSLTHDLRIRTHAHLPLQIAKERGQSRVPNFVVIDENFLGALIKNGYVEIKDLCNVMRHDMGDWLLELAKVFKAGLSIERLEAAGFTVNLCKELIKAETALAPEVEITPDMSVSETLNAATDYDGQWYKYASFWRRLRDALDAGSLNRLRVTPNKKGVYLNWRQKIAGIPWDNETNRPRVPVLILSATIKRSMVDAILPVDEWVSIEVEKHPDAKVMQVPINASKKSLLYGTGDRVEEWDETDKKDKARAAQYRADVARISEGRHLFSYKALIGENMMLAGWFNAVEGLNDWAGGKVDIVGRPLPAPQEVEDMARAIHQDGDPIVPVAQWYPKRPIAMVGGAGMAWCERHTDPRVEDVRWLICEGAMMQAAARARHIRQGCEIRLFTNMVLPVMVDEVRQFDELLPNELEYSRAPVRVQSAQLAKTLFRKFKNMSPNGIKGAVGDLFSWAIDNQAEFLEVRLKGSTQWSRAWLEANGWQYLCKRAEIVDWREPTLRKNESEDRFNAMLQASRYTQEVRAMREALEHEPWLDEDGAQLHGELRSAEGWPYDVGKLAADAKPATWPWHYAQNVKK